MIQGPLQYPQPSYRFIAKPIFGLPHARSTILVDNSQVSLEEIQEFFKFNVDSVHINFLKNTIFVPVRIVANDKIVPLVKNLLNSKLQLEISLLNSSHLPVRTFLFDINEVLNLDFTLDYSKSECVTFNLEFKFSNFWDCTKKDEPIKESVLNK